MDLLAFNELNNRLSGQLSREIYFKKHYNEIYNLIIDYNKEFIEDFKHKLYRYFNKDKEIKKCICGSATKLISINRGFQEYCSISCSNKNNTDRIKQVKLERYGDANYNNKDKFKQSIKNVYLDRKDEIISKRKITKFQRYGDANYTNKLKAANKKKLTGVKQIQERIDKKFDHIKILDVLPASAYLLYCSNCKNESTITNTRINIRIKNDKDPCPVCNDYNTGVSSCEHEIINYLKNIGINVIQSYRVAVGDTKWYQIDIYLPDYNIGIEYNGLFWHSELNKPDDYHIKKLEAIESLGIRLINIWEDEWEYKEHIVKSRLLNLLCGSKKIHARKCKIVDVPAKLAKEFLQENHLQGFCVSKFNVGLVYEDELVSIMTFGKRKINGKKYEQTEYELLRFCSKLNTNVVGAANRLLAYFLNQNKHVTKLISFANRSWSGTKNIYEKLGFDFIGKTKPNFFYFDKIEKIRFHRYKFRKNLIAEPDDKRTARQIMIDKKMYRVYDCGNFKYELNVSR